MTPEVAKSLLAFEREYLAVRADGYSPAAVLADRRRGWQTKPLALKRAVG